MKYFHVYIITICIIISCLNACNVNYGNDNNVVDLTIINGYLPKNSPTTTEAYILNNNNFNKYFSSIKVIPDNDSKIDYSKKLAGAIVLPETRYDTRIILNKAFVTDSILHIQYSVHQVLEKRDYKMKPSRLFTFDKNIPAKYVIFEYGDNIIKKPIR